VVSRNTVWLVVALLVLALAGCGGGGETTVGGPAGLAEDAGFHGVKSGELEVALEIDRYKPHRHSEEVNLRIIGPFIEAGEGHLPQLDMGIESHGPFEGREIDFNSSLSLLTDQAVMSYGPTEKEETYGPDRATFEQLKSEVEEAQGGGGEGDAGACLEAAGDFNLTQILRRPALKGKAKTLDGTPIRLVGAELALDRAIDQLIALSEDPACGAQLNAIGVPPKADLEQLKRQLEGHVTTNEVILGVDANGVLRYLEARVKTDLQGGEELEVELAVRLSGVNHKIELPRPSPSAPLNGLLSQFGIDLETVQATSGEEIFPDFIGAVAHGLVGRDP
jgi:hypothetical protein